LRVGGYASFKVISWHSLEKVRKPPSEKPVTWPHFKLDTPAEHNSSVLLVYELVQYTQNSNK